MPQQGKQKIKPVVYVTKIAALSTYRWTEISSYDKLAPKVILPSEVHIVKILEMPFYGFRA